MFTSHYEPCESTAADEPALVCSDGHVTQAYHYWRGGTGKRYLHSVYTLIGCPSMPRANYILVRRNAEDRREPLAIGQTRDEAASLNLAHIRHMGAKLGANEVHIHLLADGYGQRARVEMDLETGQASRLPLAVQLPLAS